MNWGQLMPELSKTRKVIAIEMQEHGHTPAIPKTSAGKIDKKKIRAEWGDH